MKRLQLTLLVVGLFLFVQAAQADWTPAKRLTWTSGGSYSPAIAVDSSGNLHMVWYDETSGNLEVYYKKSTDAGAAWSTSQRLTWNSGNSRLPAIAAGSSANLHVVWCDDTPGNYEIYYKKSTDGGATWSTSQKLTGTSGASYCPVIAVDSSGNLQVVWYDSTPGNNEIYYKKSMDAGATWSPSQRLTWNSGASWHPVIALDSSGNPHVVWYDDTPGNLDIYYKKSTDGGTTWPTSQRLTWTSGASYSPAIAIDSSDNLHVVWDDYTPGYPEIYYKKGANEGASWAPSQRLTWTSGSSHAPAIAVEFPGNLHLVWYDDTPGNPEIYYKKSTDGGATWTTGQRLTLTSGSSESPSISVDSSGNIHVVWMDKTPGNMEIYYMKGN